MLAGDDIDEAQLGRLVRHFYAQVRQDPELGPIFNGIVEDWPHHLEHLTAFWAGVVLGKPGFTGHPMVAHHRHRDLIRPEHFERWLGLWEASTAAVLAPKWALALQGRARAMGAHFQRGLFGSP